MGAIGALLAIVATWLIASAQTRAAALSRRSERSQYVDLVLGVVNDLEALFDPSLKLMRDCTREQLVPVQRMPINTAQTSAAIDLMSISIRDWPSVEAYKQFKTYWLNTCSAFDNTQSLHAQWPPEVITRTYDTFVAQLAARDNALSDLRKALDAARRLPV